MKVTILVLLVAAVAIWWLCRKPKQQSNAARGGRRNFGNPGNGHRFRNDHELDFVEPGHLPDRAPSRAPPVVSPYAYSNFPRGGSTHPAADLSGILGQPDDCFDFGGIQSKPQSASSAQPDTCKCHGRVAGGANVTCMKCRKAVL